jgi:hypothetical protein
VDFRLRRKSSRAADIAEGPSLARTGPRPGLSISISMGRDGQLGTVDRIAELLCCWCARQMEDAMCYAKDYKVFDDQKQAEDAQVVQERRAGLIDRLLNAANKHGEKTKAEGTSVKEVAPAK